MTDALNISKAVQDRLQEKQATIPLDEFHAMADAIRHVRNDSYIKRMHSTEINDRPLEYAPLMLDLADGARSADMSPENENKRITFICESDVPLILMKQALEADISKAPTKSQPVRTAALVKVHNALDATIKMQTALLDALDMEDIGSILDARRTFYLSQEPSRGGRSR